MTFAAALIGVDIKANIAPFDPGKLIWLNMI